METSRLEDCTVQPEEAWIYQESPINKVLPLRMLNKQIYKDTATAIRLKTWDSLNQSCLHTTEHELVQGATG